jgi:hypothetical protein
MNMPTTTRAIASLKNWFFSFTLTANGKVKEAMSHNNGAKAATTRGVWNTLQWYTPYMKHYLNFGSAYIVSDTNKNRL